MTLEENEDESMTCKVCKSGAPNTRFHQLDADHLLDTDIIHDIDSYGNQAAHIAARLNHVNCFKKLIENDVSLGKKNFVGLTPLGEAQMNGNLEIVSLIKDNYTVDDSRSTRWDKEFNTDGWEEVWSAERQKTQWQRSMPDGHVEISVTPPPVNYQLVLEARKHCTQPVVRRIHPNSAVMIFEQQRRKQQARLELVFKERQQIVQERCVTKLQALFRQRKARKSASSLLKQTIAANMIKRRLKHLRTRMRDAACVKIQSFFRMHATRAYFKEYHKERLCSYRDSRILACFVQRLWRGFKGRSYFRRRLEIATLPDPAADHEFWMQLQIEAGPPKRELGIYAEYILSGNPTSWRERNLVKRDGYYRDVSFYANTITRRATWKRPDGWVFNDVKEYYALRVQTFWRARLAKRRIRLLVKANKVLTNTFDLGKKNVSDIVSLCNYAFYVHVRLHDYDKARPLYAKIVTYMEKRVDNAFVLYSFSIFAAVSGEKEWKDIKEYVRRAKLEEERRRNGGRITASVYEISSAAFYLQAVSNEDTPNGENWHNFGLCQMLVHRDLAGARQSFLKALKLSPHNKRIVYNFNVLLQDKDYLGLQTTAQEEYQQVLMLSRKFA